MTYESRDIFGICMTYLGMTRALRLGGDLLAALLARGLRLRRREEVDGLLLERYLFSFSRSFSRSL